MTGKKVVVGMSGGVDSSVAAFLLKQQGYDVIGVTMQIWQDEENAVAEENGGCCGLSAVEDARRVAAELKIPYYVMNFRKEFKEKVMDYFAEEYLHGRTPNPCIACNSFVKWEALLNRAISIGAEYIATGHYARIRRLPSGRFSLAASAFGAKDQSYALYGLTQEQLSHTLMPVGDYSKDEIRAIAEELGLKVAQKPDSQEICFIPDDNYKRFLEEEYGAALPEGNFVNAKGQVLGRHKGISCYTVGQRKGLGIAFGKPMFVTAIRPETDEVVLGEDSEVFGRELFADRLNFMAEETIEGERRFSAKIRYSHTGAFCTVKLTPEGYLHCVFDEPQRAITPGQAVVFYEPDGAIAAGGVIR